MEKNENNNDIALFMLKALREKEGIHHIFLVPGFVIDPFLPTFRKAEITPIVAAHEGGAAYMADGYGRASQNFGVCMGIGGPGVTNMVTAISAAFADRSPILILAGKIPSDWEAKGTFQDSSGSSGIDDIAVMRPMTAFAAAVPRVDGKSASQDETVSMFLRKAVRVIHDVESLPAFLSIPEDVQTMPCSARYEPPPRGPWRILDGQAVKDVPELLAGASRIAILAGNGSVRSQACKEIREFAEKYHIPVVTTMRAKGAIPEDSEMSFGVFGVGGSLRAAKVIMGSEKAQVLLVLGATLNENNTFLRSPHFTPEKHLILVDINPNSNRDVEYRHKLVMADVKSFLEWMAKNEALYGKKLAESRAVRKEWLKKISATPEYDTDQDRASAARPIHPARAIAELRKVADKYDNRKKGINSVIVVDSGAHTFFAGHHWKSYGPNEFLFLSTTGPMGYGIAMGIGAWLARQDRPCICVVGDGSMLMHGMELYTAVRHKIPLIVVVINNGSLGNVYSRLEKRGDNAATKLAEVEPRISFLEFAKSLGADGITVEDPSRLSSAFQAAFEYNRKRRKEEWKPFVVDVVCEKRRIRPPNQEEPSPVTALRARSREIGEPKQRYNPYW